MDKKIYFFSMVVCHYRTGERIGKRLGVVLADSQEEAEDIAWNKYGDENTCGLFVEEVTEDSYSFAVYRDAV